ncbi:MAG: sigma-54 dependent transcriptional regulator [Thermoanaerobaculia bacterium]|nr:sigma-54 dependent transcriptional regulator [Thermoanaerobaculia bacterium]
MNETSPSHQTPRPSRGTVLVIDDEDYVRDSLVAILERRGFEARSASGPSQALQRLDGLDAVLLDLNMPQLGGEEFLPRILDLHPTVPVVVLTGHGSVASAVQCMRDGAVDYLLKPADPEELVFTLERCIEQSSRRRELDYLRSSEAESGAEGPLGESKEWLEAVRLAHLAAPTDTSILLLGESGTGKEELAKEIHRRSLRSDAAFVCVNCAAVPANLFESEFFGHRRGAFTGAFSDRDGRFRVADGGTLLLDEIDSLPLPAQAKVLRVLQDGTFDRVGDSTSTRVDIRLLCATNQNLDDAVAAGRFRADLLYRINVLSIRLPPLRERTGDISLLARSFLQTVGGRMGRHLEGISPEVLRVFERYPWPGNVRELQNVIERGLLLEQSDRLTLDSLPLELGNEDESEGQDSRPNPDRSGDDLNLRRQLARAERDLLVEALRRSDGVRGPAATALGIDPRNLAYYLKKHGLGESDS